MAEPNYSNILIDQFYYPSGKPNFEGFTQRERLNPTFWETAKANFGFFYDSQLEAIKEDIEFNTLGVFNPVAKLFDGADEEQEFDPDFNPFEPELISGYEEHADYFANTKNIEHFNFKKRVLDENISRRAIIRDAGFFKNLGSAFLDPVTYLPLPFGGPTIGIARSAVRVGIGSAAVVGAVEATRYPFDPLATPGEVAMSVGSAATFGALLGGIIGIPLTARARKIRDQNNRFIEREAKLNEEVDFTTYAFDQANLRNSGSRNVEDVVPTFYKKADIDNVKTESKNVSKGIEQREKILSSPQRIKAQAKKVGEPVEETKANIEREVTDLKQRQLELDFSQSSKLFKDSDAVINGKKDKIVINNREFDAKTIKTLDDADQLKSDKKHFEVAIPAITKTIKEVKAKLDKLKLREPYRLKDVQERGFQGKKYGKKLDEDYDPKNKDHREQAQNYLKQTEYGIQKKNLENQLEALPLRRTELINRQSNTLQEIKFRRQAIDKQVEEFGFASNIYIDSPLFRGIFNPLKDLLFDKTATGIAKYNMLSIGFDSGLMLEMHKRGRMMGNSVHQNKAAHKGRIRDFIMNMRSYYLQSVGMGKIDTGNLFSMSQIEWQKFYLSARKKMGGGQQLSEEEFYDKILTHYITNTVADSDAENAAIAYMRKHWDRERMEKESLGLIGGETFLKGKLPRLALDIEQKQTAIRELQEKLTNPESNLRPQTRAKFLKYIEHYEARIKQLNDEVADITLELENIAKGKTFYGHEKNEPYFPRNYNHIMIRKYRPEFEDIIANDLMERPFIILEKGKTIEKNLSRKEATELAQKATSRILMEEEITIDEMFVGQGVSKHLRHRILDIPNEKILKFIHRNPISVYKKYVNTTSGMVEFKKKFGTQKTIDDIQDEIFESAREAGHTVADAQRHFMQVRFMYDRVVTERLHKNPYSMNNYIVNLARNGAQLSYLGPVIFSTIAEPAISMMNHGVGKYMRTLVDAVFNTAMKRNIKNIEKHGEAVDIALGAAQHRMVNDMSFNTMSDSFFDRAKNGFYILNGLSPATTIMKRLDGLARTDHFIESAIKWADGKVSPFEKEYLLRYNIGLREAKKIKKLYEDGVIEKTPNGLYVGNTDKWADAGEEALAESFGNSVASGVLNAVLMGTPADKPKIVDGIVFFRETTLQKVGLGGLFKADPDYPGYVKFDIPILGLPFQFYSYALAATNKVTASFTQGALKDRVMAPILGVGLAYFSQYLRTPDYIWEELEPQDKMLRAFEYSGLAAIYTDLFYESLHTMLAVNDTNITGGFISPKYQDSAVEQGIGLMGAGPSYVTDVVQAINELVNGDMGKGMGMMLKKAPGFTLPYIRGQVNDWAAALDEKFD